MTTAPEQFTSVQIPRDRFLRPLVIPRTGGKPIPYTRCTTYIGGIEDTYVLGKWQQRHVAIGLATSPDLLHAVQVSDLDDKAGLDSLCDKAKDASGASDNARIGTYLHAVTEAHDRGQDPSVVPMPDLSVARTKDDFTADLGAYVEATRGLVWDGIEEFGVNDYLMIGGTPDRVVRIGGRRYIADLKTGSIDLGALKIAAQLAVYARSHTYDWRAAGALGDKATPEQAIALRTPPGVEVDKGLVIHLPQGTGTCFLYWVDLIAGWQAVRVCRDIRQQRTIRGRDLFSSFAAPIEAVPVTDGESLMATDLPSLIQAAPDYETLQALWRDHNNVWTDSLTQLTKARVAVLYPPTAPKN